MIATSRCTLSSNPFVERLKRCDSCGRRDTTPILRWVDFDQVELLCEPCACDQEASFTAWQVHAFAVVYIGLYQTELNTLGGSR
jgi:hypothetical protein